ncbi:hypothetical protein TNCT_604251 [Trichonephila clavata]|uniref:Uncharacterized protein n=1 Tax=Trichonephila clavata TaxID=2740835 RepID=A0A8X6HH07_TRICU|nr:hypothetical protein TNCT_604251 [Trichonephila clavata]
MGEKRDKRTQGALRSTPGTGKELFRRGTSGAVPARRPLFPIRNGSPDRAEKPRFPVPENKKKTPSPALNFGTARGIFPEIQIPVRLGETSSNPKSEFRNSVNFRVPGLPKATSGPFFHGAPRCGQGSENRWGSGRRRVLPEINFSCVPGRPFAIWGPGSVFGAHLVAGPDSGPGSRISYFRVPLDGTYPPAKIRAVTRSVRVLRAEEVFRNVAKISKSRVRNATFSNNSRKKGSNFVNRVSDDRPGRHASTEVPFVEIN